MNRRPYFRDRQEAGKRLAEKIKAETAPLDPIVLALPRGGVPVAFEVAQALQAPLDIFLVRKLGMPGHEELAIGAIASGGVRVLNREIMQQSDLPREIVEEITEREQRELERREHAYRGDRPPPNLYGKTVFLIDDGLATGATMRAAVIALKQQEPARIIVAVPIAAPETCIEFRDVVDEIICAVTPEPFIAIGMWYEEFPQMTDDEVRDYLESARALHPYR